ncbi:MAG: hypothetical protein AAGJ52_01695 [Pseudomonadota bacterium]
MGRRTPPLLIERVLLLDGEQIDPVAIELVVALQRRGQPILLMAEQPHRWRPTRRSVDHDLALQQELQQRISRAGADLDGVIYLETGLFSRKRARQSELDQIGERYKVPAADLVFIGADPILLESVILIGGKSIAVNSPGVNGAVRADSLKNAIAKLG